MTPTLMMALPPKKIDTCTMTLFRGELAVSTEVSPAPSTHRGPLSLPPPCTSSPCPPLHFTALTSGPCHPCLCCRLPTLLPASDLAVLVQALMASDLGSLSSLPADLSISQGFHQTSPWNDPFEAVSWPSHSFIQLSPKVFIDVTCVPGAGLA